MSVVGYFIPAPFISFWRCCVENKRGRIRRVKRYWEIIADNLHDAGFSLGWVSTLDLEGRTIWIVDVHGYGKRFIVRADEILTAFMELQRAIHEFAVSLILLGENLPKKLGCA